MQLLYVMNEAARIYAYEAAELSKDIGKLQATAYILRRETVEMTRQKAEQAAKPTYNTARTTAASLVKAFDDRHPNKRRDLHP